MLHNRSFTIIELMIVVAILAILAAFMIPSYVANSTQARISRVIGVLEHLSRDVKLNFSIQGTMPATLEGISGAGSGGYGTYVIDGLTTNLHYVNGSGWANQGALIQINVNQKIGKGVPGFVQSTTGLDGAYNAIAMGIVEMNGSLIIYCGRWDSTNSIFIPVNVLPSGCNSDDFMSEVTGN